MIKPMMLMRIASFPRLIPGFIVQAMSADERTSMPSFAPPWEALEGVATVSAMARPSVSDGVMSSLVGHNLRRLRKEHRWTLEDLSLRSGVSRAMLGQVEQGKSVPSIKTLWQVAQALGVSVDWFLEARHDPGVLLIRPTEAAAGALRSGEGELRPLHIATDALGDGFHELRLAPHAQLSLPASRRRRRVNVAVSAGEIELIIDEALHRVQAREALQWDGHEPITWRNRGESEAQAFVVLRSMAHLL